MAVTITNNMTLLHECNANTGWTTAWTAYTGFQRYGTNCLGAQGSNNAVQNYFTITSADYSNRTIFAWFLSGAMGTTAQGGHQIIVGDGTNRIAFYVGGNDAMGFQFGAWSCQKLDCSNPPAAYATLLGTRANLNFGAVTQIGVGMYYASKAVGNSPNCFFDVVRSMSNASPALTIGGGTSVAPGLFSEIVTQDDSTSNAWGVLRTMLPGSKAYHLNFGVEFGNSGTAASYFDDEEFQLYLFGQAGGMNHAAGTLNVGLTGNTTGINSFKLTNATIVSLGAKSNWDLDSTVVDIMALDTIQFIGLANIYLPDYDVDKSVLSCVFNGCAEVYAGTCTIELCDFINSPANAVRMSSVSHNIKDCAFSGCSRGVHIILATIADITFSALIFTTCTYDVINTSGGSVNVSLTNGSNASTYDPAQNAVVFIASVALTLISVPVDTLVTIVEVADRDNVLQQSTAGATGIITYNYGSSEINLVVDILFMNTLYDPLIGDLISYTLGSGDVTIPISLVSDPTYI